MADVKYKLHDFVKEAMNEMKQLIHAFSEPESLLSQNSAYLDEKPDVELKRKPKKTRKAAPTAEAPKLTPNVQKGRIL